MGDIVKDRSPFYPNHPVPVELFAGRKEQIDRIVNRGIHQVRSGKPVSMFIEGEYGIGKSSIAGLAQHVATREANLHTVYVTLGGCKTVNDVALAMMEASITSVEDDKQKLESVKDWFSKYIREISLFGMVSFNMEALKRDAPNLSSVRGALSYFKELTQRINATGLFLVLDEINGVAADPYFSHFIKGLVDTNAMSQKPLHLLLMVCGVKERRNEMIQAHQPIDRIFDVIDIGPMSKQEIEEFYVKSFASAQMTIDQKSLELFAYYTAGFPKIMHLVGDAAYWLDQTGHITEDIAVRALILAAEEMGKKYIDLQVYDALRSSDYHSILKKIGQREPYSMKFNRKEIAEHLTDVEQRKLDNFLTRMRKLNVIRSGDVRGEYIFNLRMARLYIWLQSIEEKESLNSKQYRG